MIIIIVVVVVVIDIIVIITITVQYGTVIYTVGHKNVPLLFLR